MKVLELGCGFNKTPGAFGIDIIRGSQADILHDLNTFPYPFADSEWDRILCRDVLEHLDAASFEPWRKSGVSPGREPSSKYRDRS